MTDENHEKTPVKLVGTGIRTRDLPNASLVRYHGATSLGFLICIDCLSEGAKLQYFNQVTVKIRPHVTTLHLS